MKKFFLFNVSFFLCGNLYAAQGISSPFVDVVVLDVPLGTPKTVQDNNGRGLILQNTSNETLRIHVDVLTPHANQLRGNAEAIPDPSWITVEPSDLILPPQSSADCQVRVLVPREKRFYGRFYQAMLWTRARRMESSGISVSIGLLSRLRIKTAAK